MSPKGKGKQLTRCRYRNMGISPPGIDGDQALHTLVEAKHLMLEALYREWLIYVRIRIISGSESRRRTVIDVKHQKTLAFPQRVN